MEKIVETDFGRCVIRPYRPEDEERVLSLWAAAFESKLDPQVWRWKYLENPYREQIVLCVGEEGKLLVMYGGIPYRANWKGEVVEITQLADIMSHPDCRGSGIFVRTGAAFFDFFAGPGRTIFYYGLPGKYHFDIGEKYLEYKALEGGVNFLTARTGDLARGNLRFGGRIMETSSIGHTFDRLWKKCCGSYPFSVIRTGDFLRWRFLEHPVRKYEIWEHKSYLKKGLNAYAVFSIKGEKARLIDMLAPASNRLITDFLVRLGARFFERGIEEMAVWLPAGHFLSDAAISAGFAPAKEPVGIIPTGRVFHPALSFDWVSENLYYTMADADLF